MAAKSARANPTERLDRPRYSVKFASDGSRRVKISASRQCLAQGCGPPAVQQAGRAMLGAPDAARDQSRLSRWHTRSSVLAHKSGSGPLAQSGTDENGEEIGLLARVAAGEGEACRGLVDRHLPTVLAIARRMLRDDAEAEDVAQETMLRLWRNAAGLELGPNGLRPWLRRVASNLCIDRVRSRRNVQVVQEVPEESAPPTQVRHLSERELGARVDAALQALPERQRLAITLFHYEGMSQIEVGNVLGISDEAVESLLARARRALKAALKEEWRALIPESEA